MEIKIGVMTREVICLGMARLESNLTNTTRRMDKNFAHCHSKSGRSFASYLKQALSVLIT